MQTPPIVQARVRVPPSLALALCVPLWFAACAKQEPAALAPPLPVKTVVLGGDAQQPAESYPIAIVRDRESNVSFRVGGVIQSLAIRAGQTVQPGQVLATLKPTPYASQRTRAETDVNTLQNAVRRNAELVQAGAVSVVTKEDTEDALIAAKAALGAARYDEESTVISAPFKGVVLSRDAEVGETIAPGQRIIRIADLDSTVIAKASVPTQVAKALRVGGGAKVHVGDAVLAAHIRLIGAQTDPKTGALTVDLVLAQGAAIASGTLGSVEFEQSSTAQSPDFRLLPPEALLESKNGLGYVFVFDAKASVARRTPVRVLGFDGEMVRISGLERGTKVLTAGAGFVTDGQKVQELAP